MVTIVARTNEGIDLLTAKEFHAREVMRHVIGSLPPITGYFRVEGVTPARVAEHLTNAWIPVYDGCLEPRYFTAAYNAVRAATGEHPVLHDATRMSGDFAPLN